jgi:YVTN family beta-propeller protein
MELQGFSLLPPVGKDWFIEPARSMREVVFTKSLGEHVSKPADLSTVVATVRIIDTANAPETLQRRLRQRFQTSEDFVRFVEWWVKDSGAEYEHPRFRLIEASVKLDQTLGPYCARVDALVEDYRVPQFPNSVFLQSDHTIRCLHPHDARFMLWAGYSQRYLKGEQPAAIAREEGEPFLQSVVFLPFPFDPTARVTTIPVGSLLQGLAFSNDLVWVARPKDNAVSPIDPRTQKPMAMIPVGKDPIDVVANRDAVWISNRGSGTVSRLDPVTRQVVVNIPVGFNPFRMAVGEDSLWVTGSGKVAQINLSMNQVTATITVEDAWNVAVAKDTLWITQPNRNTIVRIDLLTSQIVATIPVGKGPVSVLVAANSVWVANDAEGTVSRVNPQTNRVETTIPVGRNPTALAEGRDIIWVANAGDATVSRIDTRTNALIGAPVAVGRGPAFLALSDHFCWITNAAEGTISQVEF